MLRNGLQRLSQGLSGSISSSSVLTTQPCRTTFVVKRKWPPVLGNKGQPPKLRRRNYIYEVVENTRHKPMPNVRVILTDNVEGFGARGEIIEARAHQARNWLLPSGLAVYPSPENLEKYENVRQDHMDTGPKHTAFAIKTIRQLRGMSLEIPMNRDKDWTLNKTHVRVAFRKLGVEVPEECITMPDKEITRQDADRQFTVGVTVNGIEKVDVSAKIYFWELDELGRPPLPRNIWRKQAEMAELEKKS